MSSDLAFLEGLDSSLSDVGGQLWHATPLWKQCPDCRYQDYCDLHRCNALNARGKRCPNAADPRRGLEYCYSHGCHHTFQGGKGIPTVFCMNRSEKYSDRCADHESDRPPSVYTYR